MREKQIQWLRSRIAFLRTRHKALEEQLRLFGKPTPATDARIKRLKWEKLRVKRRLYERRQELATLETSVRQREEQSARQRSPVVTAMAFG